MPHKRKLKTEAERNLKRANVTLESWITTITTGTVPSHLVQPFLLQPGLATVLTTGNASSSTAGTITTVESTQSTATTAEPTGEKTDSQTE